MTALLHLAAEARRKGRPFYPTRSRYMPFYSVYGRRVFDKERA
jgi:hypothetical protein